MTDHPEPAAVLPLKRPPPPGKTLGPDPSLAPLLETHEAMARELGAELTRVSGQPPVFAEGRLFTADGATWRARDDRELRNLAATMFQGRKRANTQRDFAQIVERQHDRAHDPDFFAGAPIGVATPSHFWTIAERRLVRESRAPSQRQRFELPCDPRFDDDGEPAEAPLFAGFLDETFTGEDSAAQMALLQEVFGAALLGLLALFQVAILLWGKTRAGRAC